MGYTVTDPGPDGGEGQELARALLVHRDSLFSYILGLVRDPVAAEDLFQQVSLVILKKDQGTLRVEKFGPWSRELAKRTVLAHWKQERRGRRLLSEAALGRVESAFERQGDDADLVHARLEGLRACLARLPE